MKRDFELIRKLLFFFEGKKGPEHIIAPEIDGYDKNTIQYHLILLHDAGLLRCEPERSSTSDRVIRVIPFDLTWDGHEFLDNIRSDSIWKKVGEVIASKGAAFTFGIVNHLATRFAIETING